MVMAVLNTMHARIRVQLHFIHRAANVCVKLVIYYTNLLMMIGNCEWLIE